MIIPLYPILVGQSLKLLSVITGLSHQKTKNYGVELSVMQFGMGHFFWLHNTTNKRVTCAPPTLLTSIFIMQINSKDGIQSAYCSHYPKSAKNINRISLKQGEWREFSCPLKFDTDVVVIYWPMVELDRKRSDVINAFQVLYVPKEAH